MRPSVVVVLEERSQHTLQMPAAEDQKMVQALAARCAHKPLGDGIRPRGTVRQAHDFHAFRAEDLIEGGRELGIPIAGRNLAERVPVPYTSLVNSITRLGSTVGVGTALPGWTPVGRPPAQIQETPNGAPALFVASGGTSG